VQRGIRWIQGHLSSPELNLSQTAKAAGISPNYFSTLFRQELGVHFAAYVTQLRMEQATELLRTTDLPVHQVGLRVGYQNARYFSDQFRQNVWAASRWSTGQGKASAREGQFHGLFEAKSERSGLKQNTARVFSVLPRNSQILHSLDTIIPTFVPPHLLSYPSARGLPRAPLFLFLFHPAHGRGKFRGKAR
jgi:hypothetical protein